MPPTEEQLQQLRDAFERYLELPRHRGDADFKQRLSELQDWEIESIRRRHATICADQPHYARVLEFYLHELHNGLPLDGMIARGPGGLDQARRMDKAFPLFANCIECSVQSAALQDRLVETLGDQPLTSASYRAAIKACGDLQEREERLDRLNTLGQQMAPHVRSRMIYTGFKLLKGMFHAVGLHEIYVTMDKGFKQLRDVSRLAQIMAEIVDLERRHLNAELQDS